MVKDYKNLFQSIEIRNVKIKNRFAMAPMGLLGLSDSEGGFSQRAIDYLVERAKGGVGLIITGVSFVDNEVEVHSLPSSPFPNHNPVHFVRTAKEMTERVHSYDTKIFMQLSAGFGRVLAPSNYGESRWVAPSPIPHRWLDETCHELTVEEIKTIVNQFGKAAYNCKCAGVDGVEIHAVHEGYLLDQFAISFFNQRTDKHGGSLENRLRFTREVVEEIKEKCGEDYPVTLRYSLKSFIKDWRDGALPGEEFVEKGRDLDEGVKAARLLVAYGYDALDVDVGCYDAWWWSHPPMYQEKGLYRPYAKLMKETVNVPIICAGRMDNPDMASAALKDGTCDMIGLGRPLLADPDYVIKLKTGKTEEIRPCLSCQEGCMGRIQNYGMVNCAVNPRAGRESMSQLKPVIWKKKVLIAGGGVAGCEAARVLALRGHEPVLYEKSCQIGGNLLPGGVPDFKKDDHVLINWYNIQLQKLQVNVHLNAEVTLDLVMQSGADAVIVATGSTPKVFSLGDDEKVYTAAEVLLQEKNPGQEVVVIGGGLVGCETALWLRQQGKKVTIVEALDKLLALNAPLCHANHDMLEKLISYHNIVTITNAKALKYSDRKLVVEAQDGIKYLPCDSVVLSVGYKENSGLYKDLQFEVPEIYKIGDARMVANILYGVWDAYELANHI